MVSFFTWSLRVLAGFASKEMSHVDAIIHTKEVRSRLLMHGRKDYCGIPPEPRISFEKKS
jgi:hypothetical protein